jgi:hypothetical protein
MLVESSTQYSFRGLKRSFFIANFVKAITLLMTITALFSAYDLLKLVSGSPPQMTGVNIIQLGIAAFVAVLGLYVIYHHLDIDVNEVNKQLEPYKLRLLRQACEGYAHEVRPLEIFGFGMQVKGAFWLTPRFHVIVDETWKLTFNWRTGKFMDNDVPWFTMGTLEEVLERAKHHNRNNIKQRPG